MQELWVGSFSDCAIQLSCSAGKSAVPVCSDFCETARQMVRQISTTEIVQTLIDKPPYQADDLGQPLPESPHAVSVSLPTWQDNIGYEEDDPRVHSRLSTGYPRFVYNGLCQQLFQRCAEQFAKEGENCLVMSSIQAAERLQEFLQDRGGADSTAHDVGRHGAVAVCFPSSASEAAKSFWQHTGEGISSRHAEACLEDQPVIDASAAEQAIRERVANGYGVPAEDVFLFPNGMNAIFHLHRAVRAIYPDRKSVQFGFPYVDTLKIQSKFGPGAHFFPQGSSDDLEELDRIRENEWISAIFTEFPSNPLLVSPDLRRLAVIARSSDAPLIVDDTLAALFNADLLSVADVLATSLTKFFSGVGDVAAGSLVLNRSSQFYEPLSTWLRAEARPVNWAGDLQVLERNSRDVAERLPAINAGAEALADFLHGDPRIADVYYPKFQTPELFERFRRPNGGYGGLLSIVLKDAEQQTARFYDALPVCKGPNLGTSYTLACPYTILAHYRELPFAEECGVSRYLIRVSVGLEEPKELIGRFQQALDALSDSPE